MRAGPASSQTIVATQPNKIGITGITGLLKPLLGIGDGGGSFPKCKRLRGCLRGAIELEGRTRMSRVWVHALFLFDGSQWVGVLDSLRRGCEQVV